MLDELKFLAGMIVSICAMVAIIVITAVTGNATKATACIQQQMEWVDNNCTRSEEP